MYNKILKLKLKLIRRHCFLFHMEKQIGGKIKRNKILERKFFEKDYMIDVKMSTRKKVNAYVNNKKRCSFKGTNGRQKTYEIFHVYCIFYSGFMCQTTVIFGITKDGGLVLNILAS